MPKRSSNHLAVGVSEHAGWAVFVTASFDGALVDRRRVELLGPRAR